MVDNERGERLVVKKENFKEVPLLAILTRNISSNFSPEFLPICHLGTIPKKIYMLPTFEKSTFCKGLYGENDGPST